MSEFGGRLAVFGVRLQSMLSSFSVHISFSTFCVDSELARPASDLSMAVHMYTSHIKRSE